jgi:oligoendopeptidase F
MSVRRHLSFPIVVLSWMIPPLGAAAGTPPASPADDVRWDLSDLYPNPGAWNEAYARTRSAAEMLGRFTGTLGQSSESLLAALDAQSAVNRESERLETYAQLLRDQDLRIAENRERFQQSERLETLIEENTAWLAPDILGVGATTVRRFEDENPDLKRRFGFFLDNTLRAEPHTLGAEGEGVLASAHSLLQQPGSIQGLLTAGELPYPTVVLSDGKKIKLDQPAYEKYRRSPDRQLRKRVFDAFWATWRQYEGVVGDVLTTQVMGDAFIAKSRKFPGSVDAALFADAVPTQVYRTLVTQANASLPTLQRYLRLRRRLLGLTGPLEYYDNYVPMFALKPEPHFTIDSAKRTILAALQPLGDDYLSLLRRGFDGRWMDALPRPGKNPGGYMDPGAYDVHPYLLFNFNGDYISMSTMAHEWGHAVHTLLADRAQPYETSHYSTFVAEAASMGNEMLLNDYMIDHAASDREKLYYLGQALEYVRTGYYRQALFAEFELDIHDALEHGQPLSGARLTDTYCGLLKKYYGDGKGVSRIDPAYCAEWEYIPHFYFDFYVYKYGTCIATAAALTDAILKEGESARKRFLDLLSAGGSDYPYELLRRVGIDLATPAPYQALDARMNRIMNQIEMLESKQRPASRAN